MRSTSMWLRCAAHLALGAGSALWLLRTRRDWLAPPTASALYLDTPYTPGLGLAAALAMAALTVHSTRWLVTHTRWAHALHLTLRGSLLGATSSQMVLLASVSASAEELFFRGVLGPSVGFVGSSLLFGLAHGFSRESRAQVAVWSFGMGLAFCALYLASGTLLAPVLAHCVINYENMQYICNYDPTPLDIDRSSLSTKSESDG